MTTYYRNIKDGTVFATICPEYYGSDANYQRVTAKEGKAAVKEQERQYLRGVLNPGDTVYTLIRHVSASGMRRELSVFVVSEGRIRDITNPAAFAVDATIGKHCGIIVNGCGFDAGFDLVYRLGKALWPEGTPEPHGTRNGGPDSDGGYALKHAGL